MIFLIVFGILLIVSTFIIIILKKRKDIYIKYLLENSLAIKQILDLNNKYNFYNVKNFDESNTYDNEKFFDNISCEDYLIYQLQFKKYDVEKEIKKINYNNEKYNLYYQELIKINNFGEYITSNNKLNKKYLLKIEKNLFTQMTLSPETDFNIRIILYCSKINGEIYKQKKDIFSSDEILNLIKRLNNKNREYYNDKNIWDSICRVERGRVSNKMRFAIYKRDGYRCCNCGRTEFSDYLEIDHIKPISKGGKSTYDNLQTLCRRCNKEKGNNY